MSTHAFAWVDSGMVMYTRVGSCMHTSAAADLNVGAQLGQDGIDDCRLVVLRGEVHGVALGLQEEHISDRGHNECDRGQESAS